MYKIKQIKLKDFVIFDDVDIKFDDDSKLYLIKGEYINNSNRSNGSGKTSFVQAIIFGLFGISFRNIVKTGKTQAQVYIKLQDKDNIVEILRIKKNNSNRLKIKINGEIKSFVKMKDKQQYLNSLLLNNSDINLYLRTVFFANYLNNLHFINLTTTKQIQIIEELLGFHLLDDIYNKIRTTENKLNIEKDKYTSNIQVLKVQIKKYQSNKSSDVTSNTINKEQQEIDKLKQHLDELKNKYNDIQKQYNNSKYKTNISKDILKYMKQKHICPVCKSEITKDKYNELLLEYEKAIQYRKLQNEMNEIENNIYQVQSQIQFKSNNIKKLYEIKNNVNKLDKSRINELKDNIKQYKEKINEIEQDLELYEYLHNIFNTRSKVRSNIINNYLEILSEQTYEYLKIYDPNIKDFKIKIVADDKKKLSTLIIIKDGIEITNLSEGEKTKIQISLILSFIYMLFSIYKCNLGLIFFDEIFNTLDQNTLDTTLEILNSFSNENDFQIFIITHNKIKQDYFNRILEVKRYENYSVINNVPVT